MQVFFANLGKPLKPDEIKKLRQTLRCTPRELGEALGVDAKTVMAWEQDDQFPTKRYVDAMDQLREEGPGAVPRLRRGGRSNPPLMQLLNDPELWRLFRKMLAHKELRDKAAKLAESYDDPSDGDDRV